MPFYVIYTFTRRGQILAYYMVHTDYEVHPPCAQGGWTQFAGCLWMFNQWDKQGLSLDVQIFNTGRTCICIQIKLSTLYSKSLTKKCVEK